MWSYLLSVPCGAGYGPKVVWYADGLAVNEGDLVLPTQLQAGTGTGTPGTDAISVWHVVQAGTLGPEPSGYPAASEDTFKACGTAILRSKNLYHFDPSATSNGTGSQTSPVNVHGSASGANGRVVATREGTTYSGTANFGMSGNPTNKTYGWAITYNTGLDSGKPVVGALPIGNCRWVVVDGYKAVGTGVSNGLTYTQGSGVSCDKVYFRNNEAIGVRNTSDGNNNGLVVFSTDGCLPITSLYIDRQRSENCGGYGVGIEGATTLLDAVRPIQVTEAYASNCGLDKFAWNLGGYATHNLSLDGSAFTQVSGTLYRTAETKQVFRVAEHGGNSFRHLTQNILGTPGAQEWYWDGTHLYIDINLNLGSTLAGHRIYWSYGYCDGVAFTRCTSVGAKSIGGADGSGIGADTLTSGWIIEDSVIQGCDGSGIVFNISRGGTIDGNTCVGNGLVTGAPGIEVNNCITSTVTHNTVVDSVGAGLAGSNPNGAVVVKNNIFLRNASGIGMSGLVEASNNAYYENPPVITTGPTDVFEDPQLDSAYVAQNPALNVGVFLGGTDRFGVVRRNPPTIGMGQFLARVSEGPISGSGWYVSPWFARAWYIDGWWGIETVPAVPGGSGGDDAPRPKRKEPVRVVWEKYKPRTKRYEHQPNFEEVPPEPVYIEPEEAPLELPKEYLATLQADFANEMRRKEQEEDMVYVMMAMAAYA